MTDDNTHNGQSDSPAVDQRPEGQMTQKGNTLVLRAYRLING